MHMSPPTPALVPTGLAAQTLTAGKEKSYFVWVLLISIVAWAALAVSIIGLLYAALIGFFVWMGNGLLTAQLRAEAARVGPDQLPELDATFRQVCAQLGVRDVPALFVVQSGGLLNAFATRFAGRNFVVVYSDFLEALGASSPEMRFVLGHELGHIQSRHIAKQIFLAPGMFFPLVGPAYRRAWETSCDRFGAYAAQDVTAAVRAMMVLTAGAVHGPQLNPLVFAGQNEDERGFFVSLHELTSTYPTLSRRVTDLVALQAGRPAERPRRNPFAYVFAMFIPGGNVGSGGPVAGTMMTVMLMGLLAAMAIPAFQKVRASSQAKACINNTRMLAAALDQHHLEKGKGPETWDEIVGAGKLISAMPVCLLGGEYSAMASANGYHVECSLAAHDPAALAANGGLPPTVSASAPEKQ